METGLCLCFFDSDQFGVWHLGREGDLSCSLLLFFFSPPSHSDATRLDQVVDTYVTETESSGGTFFFPCLRIYMISRGNRKTEKKIYTFFFPFFLFIFLLFFSSPFSLWSSIPDECGLSFSCEGHGNMLSLQELWRLRW